MKIRFAIVGWLSILAFAAPVVHTIWVSFSPDSFLTPPTSEWSLRWYGEFFSNGRWLSAFGRSLGIALLSSILAVLLASPASRGVEQTPRWFRRIANFLLPLPAAIPPAALGLGLLPLFDFFGLRGTLLSLVLVHTALSIPFAFLILRTLAPQELCALESAARGLGASSFGVVRRVRLPLMMPALIAATTTAFLLSLNESLVTIFLASPSSETLPAVIWPQLRYAVTPLVAAAATLLAGVGLLGQGILSFYAKK